MTSLATQEAAVRRKLAAAGYRLQKTPSRHWTRAHYGPGYEVIDNRNCVVLGCSQREFDATIVDVEEFAEAHAS